MMRVLQTDGRVLRINAPEWFEIPAFRTLLNDGTDPLARRQLATFHRHGVEPNEYSDVFIPFDAYPVGMDEWGQEVWTAEGSDIFCDDGLHDVANAIASAAKAHGIGNGVAWISNLADGS